MGLYSDNGKKKETNIVQYGNILGLHRDNG